MEHFKSFGRLGSHTIGMNIDRGAIKAVQISGGGGEYALQHVGYHRLPRGAVVEGEVADHDLLAAEIREFCESHSFGRRSVVIGVSNQKVVARLLDFPRTEPEDLRETIGFDVQDHNPHAA